MYKCFVSNNNYHFTDMLPGCPMLHILGKFNYIFYNMYNKRQNI